MSNTNRFEEQIVPGFLIRESGCSMPEFYPFAGEISDFLREFGTDKIGIYAEIANAEKRVSDQYFGGYRLLRTYHWVSVRYVVENIYSAAE